MHRALRVRSTLAWLTAATLDEEPAAGRDAAGHARACSTCCPPTASSSACRARRAAAGAGSRPDVADAIAAWAAGRGDDVVATDSLPQVAPQLGAPGRARLRRARAAAARGPVRAVVPRRGGAPRRLGRRPAQQGDRRARGRRGPAEPPQVLRPLAGDRPRPVGAVDDGAAGRGRRAAHPPARGALRPLAQRRAGGGDAAAQPALRAAGARPPGGGRPLRARPRARPRSAATGTTCSPQPDGSTMLVIGDVVGHDTEAAACMGQLRGLLRGIAFDSADGPAGVLTRLDAAIDGLRLGALATVLVGRLERPDARAWPAALGERRAPAAAGRGARTASDSVLDRRAARPAARGRPHGRAHRAGGRPRRPARPCCSTPTGSSSAATRSSTTASSSCGAALGELRGPAGRGAVRRAAGPAAAAGAEDDVALVAVRLPET